MEGLLWGQIAAGRVVPPKAVVDELARANLRRRANSLRLWRAAVLIRQRLANRGIGVAMAKGVAAEARWYDAPGERPSGDLDLFLEPGAQHRLREALEALRPDHVRQGDAALLLTAGVLPSIDLEVAGVAVDLHAHADLFKIGVPLRQSELPWLRRCEVVGPAGPVDALDAELSLVHFLVHLNRDRFRFLLGFSDVARVLQREQLDWDFVEDFVRREGIEPIVYNALDAVVSALDLPYPPLPRPRGFRARIWRALWPEESRLRRRAARRAVPYRRQFYLGMLAHGRFREAVRWFIRGRLLPPKALIDVYHGDVRGPYLARLIVGRRRQRREGRRRRMVSTRIG